MTTLVKWGAFPELASLQDEVNRLFDGTFRNANEATTVREWVPRVNIQENENVLTMEFEIPGVKQEDLDIRIEKGTLTVRGERKAPENFENYRRVERLYGNFARVFTLPDYVDTEKVDATLENGLLHLTLAKREETKPKQIQVQVKKS
jgi:HSP20 family protein